MAGQLVAGKLERLNASVRRLVAPNPGKMTGAGTNTYLLGDKDIALIDPGPAIDSHIEAIIDAVGDRLRWILCTHTHSDHSPAWQKIAAATGAQVLGASPPDDRFQDKTFKPDIELHHDFLLETPEFGLRAIHTPGHVGNHYCFLINEEQMVFAGDHIMNGSTVVIIPPSGDMKAYIESLQRLWDYSIATIAPGHGEVITDAKGAIDWLIAHRLKREKKVADALRDMQQADLDGLVKTVYDDVDIGLHSMAKLSLTAHLIKLQQEGFVAEQAGDWRWL